MLNEANRDFEASPSRGLQQAVRTLARRVERALRDDREEERTLRLSEPVEGVEPLLWLRSRKLSPKTYWSGREGGFEAAAAGAADTVLAADFDGFLGLRELLFRLARTDGNVRYYGGVRFDPEGEASEEWSPFGAYRFVLPRFELAVENGVYRLACNLVLPRDFEKRARILAELTALESGPGASSAGETLPRFAGREDRPAFEGWKKNVELSLGAFAEGDLGKIVLARRAGLRFAEDLDAGAVLQNLRARTPGCFHFYFEPPAGGAFFGASPERLYWRDGRALKSEAVAGTRPRGASISDDDELRDELLESEKDLDEHRFVRESIREDLGSLCEALKVEEGSSEMKLSTRRHLVSRFRGMLREGVSDADLLEILHPTPAVGGYPKVEARRKIKEMEPFDRGWYAGPVGWISATAAEFAVGIRSGLARENELALFSGAGIVSGSTPGGEWAEIEQKVSDFAGVLGLDRRVESPLEHSAG